MFVLIVEMAQHDSAAAALVKKSNNLVAPSLELTVNKTRREKVDENSGTAFVDKFFKLAGPKISTCCGSLRFMGL